MALVDFGYFLARKYALQQQEADAATKNASSNALQAAAGARLTGVQADVLPATSKAQIAQMGANTNLITEQAKVVGPEAFARIGQLKADTFATNVSGQIAAREGLMERSVLPESLTSVMGGSQLPSIGGTGTGRRGFSLADPIPARRRGETEVSYLDRINGL